MVLQLTQAEIQGYMKQGYSMQEIQEAIGEVNRQGSSTVDPRASTKYSAFASKKDENLIKWQLELNEMLERAEHILRGDILKFEDGHVIWRDNPNPDEKILNDQGVQEIMRILSMYLNRNTILADYTQDIINNKMYDFGKELNDLFYMKYEKLFETKSFSDWITVLDLEGQDFNNEETMEINILMDNQLSEKVKNYPMLVRSCVDIVHSAYQRALDGGERRSLNESRQVLQQDNMAQQMFQQPKKRSVFKPWTYFGGN